MNESFKNLTEVLKYLKDSGYKIQKTKLYADKKKGLIKIQSDNSVNLSDVKLYAGTLNKVTDEGNVIDVVTCKTEKEVQKLEIQVEQAQFNLDKDRGKFIEKKKFNQELSARAAVLETGIKHMFQSNISEWVASVCGDPLKANQLLERMNLEYNSYINEYASKHKFQVIVIENE
jgi:hypothetical protein